MIGFTIFIERDKVQEATIKWLCHSTVSISQDVHKTKPRHRSSYFSSGIIIKHQKWTAGIAIIGILVLLSISRNFYRILVKRLSPQIGTMEVQHASHLDEFVKADK